MNMKPMGRLKYAYCKGGAVSWLAFAALLLAAVLVGVCFYTALFGSVLDMPFSAVINVVTNGAVDELKEEIARDENIQKEAEAALKEFRKELSGMSRSERELLDAAEDTIDDVGTLMDTPSLMIARDVFRNISTNKELIELLKLADSEDAALRMQEEAKNILQVLDIVIIVVTACFGLCLLLTFLAAILRSTVLAVFGMLGAVVLCALFGGVVFYISVLVLDITAMILHGVLKKKYMNYCYSGNAG